MGPGGQGAVSGRPFDPQAAGGPIRELNYEGVRISPRGVGAVEQHLSRFTQSGFLGASEQAMLDRIREISAETREPSEYDLRFYTHELREFVRYRALGFETGQPTDADEAYNLWNNAHTATLEDYRINE